MTDKEWKPPFWFSLYCVIIALFWPTIGLVSAVSLAIIALRILGVL